MGVQRGGSRGAQVLEYSTFWCQEHHSPHSGRPVKIRCLAFCLSAEIYPAEISTRRKSHQGERLLSFLEINPPKRNCEKSRPTRYLQFERAVNISQV